MGGAFLLRVGRVKDEKKRERQDRESKEREREKTSTTLKTNRSDLIHTMHIYIIQLRQLSLWRS